MDKLVWVLSGGDFDPHCGEILHYSAVELDYRNSLSLSSLTANKHWSGLSFDKARLEQLLKKGKRFLCREGYLSEEGYFETTDDYSEKLKELLLRECLFYP